MGTPGGFDGSILSGFGSGASLGGQSGGSIGFNGLTNGFGDGFGAFGAGFPGFGGSEGLVDLDFAPRPTSTLPIGTPQFDPRLQQRTGSTAGGGGIVGSVFGGISDFLGGGTLGTIGGVLGTAALAGGLGLLLSGGGGGATSSSSTQRQSIPPPSAAELELLGINSAFAIDQLRAFREQFNSQQVQNEFLESLFNSFKREQDAANANVSPEARGAIEASRVAREQALIPFENEFGEILLRDARTGNTVTPEQLARIQGAADTAIESGLSDLGRFRDEGLNQVRLNSAGRGLRPGDTPIQNDFANVNIEADRQAQQLVRGIRGSQFDAQLNFPLAANELTLRQAQAGTDIAQRRRAFEAQLVEQARNQRLSLGQGASAVGTSLATGLNPNATLATLAQTRAAQPNITTTERPSTLSTIGQIAGGIGGLAQGAAALGVRF